DGQARRRLPGHLRPGDQRPPRHHRARGAHPRPAGGGRRHQRRQGAALPFGGAGGAGPGRDGRHRRPHRRQAGGGALRRAAGRVRAPGGRGRHHPRPARRFGLRLRVPDGRHEPPLGPNCGDGVLDGERDAPIHLLALRQGDRAPRRRRGDLRAEAHPGADPGARAETVRARV
ncbi:MAG: Phosphopantetheine adenylyltransferase, partial [uncultured Acetobacteraceae bacterium]